MKTQQRGTIYTRKQLSDPGKFILFGKGIDGFIPPEEHGASVARQAALDNRGPDARQVVAMTREAASKLVYADTRTKRTRTPMSRGRRRGDKKK